MASMRDIKQRIKSVGNTQQITKAMHLVSTSKLQKAKNQLQITKPYFNEMKRTISSIVKLSKGVSHPYMQDRYAKNSVFIVVTGDRGLCGGYNVNICKKASSKLKQVSKQNDVSVIAIGSKSRDYFRRRNRKILKLYEGISEQPYYEDASAIGSYILDLYENGQVDEVYLAYTEFNSIISHEPTVTRLLPVDTSQFNMEEGGEKSGGAMEFEPSPEAVLDYVVPSYISTIIYGALVESAACEQGARMTAMDSATNNATEMIDNLTLLYNRARQSAITQEINEIVSGANALD